MAVGFAFYLFHFALLRKGKRAGYFPERLSNFGKIFANRSILPKNFPFAYGQSPFKRRNACAG